MFFVLLLLIAPAAGCSIVGLVKPPYAATTANVATLLLALALLLALLVGIPVAHRFG